MENDKNLQIATFKFGVISEFVTGMRLEYGDKERLIKEKLARSYAVPYSIRDRIARSTIEKWICDYKKAGFRLEGLYPKERKDKGKARSLSDTIKLAIKEIKKEDPHLQLAAIITALRHRKLIAADEVINASTVYRYIKSEQLTTVNEDAKDKRHFEASAPNEIWQSDVMHGPYVLVDGKLKKSYLIAIIDDHSRLIVHAEFYLAETLKNFLDCLRLAVMTRGLPQKLYIDNGSCYKALHLEQVAAQLGIGITHSRPYIPQGRGKIERWFKFVRDNFLQSLLTGEKKEKLDLLNHHFSEWVHEYNHNRVHSTTKQKPYDRYRDNLACVRPAPKDIIDYFRQIEFRRVKKDRTVRLYGILLEAPVGLIDRQVELRFHPEILSEVEIFFQGKSFGMAICVNPHINAAVGRNWDTNSESKTKRKKSKEEVPNNQIHVTPTGQLFGGSTMDEKNEETKL